ncbi:ATP-binding protein, partial [Thermodesulfobacteriota bacterium]
KLQIVESEKKARLKIDSLPPATGDRAMIQEVLMNLLSNALKYSSTREAAFIEVSAKTEGNEHVYSVKDNGVGFDMKYSDKLFDVFQRLHSTKEFEGTGIGLSLVQRIVQRHGGRVWGEGKVNEGATFYFSLPKS